MIAAVFITSNEGPAHRHLLEVGEELEVADIYEGSVSIKVFDDPSVAEGWLDEQETAHNA